MTRKHEGPALRALLNELPVFFPVLGALERSVLGSQVERLKNDHLAPVVKGSVEPTVEVVLHYGLLLSCTKHKGGVLDLTALRGAPKYLAPLTLWVWGYPVLEDVVRSCTVHYLQYLIEHSQHADRDPSTVATEFRDFGKRGETSRIPSFRAHVKNLSSVHGKLTAVERADELTADALAEFSGADRTISPERLGEAAALMAGVNVNHRELGDYLLNSWTAEQVRDYLLEHQLTAELHAGSSRLLLAADSMMRASSAFSKDRDDALALLPLRSLWTAIEEVDRS